MSSESPNRAPQAKRASRRHPRRLCPKRKSIGFPWRCVLLVARSSSNSMSSVPVPGTKVRCPKDLSPFELVAGLRDVLAETCGTASGFESWLESRTSHRSASNPPAARKGSRTNDGLRLPELHGPRYWDGVASGPGVGLGSVRRTNNHAARGLFDRDRHQRMSVTTSPRRQPKGPKPLDFVWILNTTRRSTRHDAPSFAMLLDESIDFQTHDRLILEADGLEYVSDEDHLAVDERGNSPEGRSGPAARGTRVVRFRT